MNKGVREEEKEGHEPLLIQHCTIDFHPLYTPFIGFSSPRSQSQTQSCQMKFPVRKSNFSYFPGENLLRGIRFSLPHNIKQAVPLKKSPS